MKFAIATAARPGAIAVARRPSVTCVALAAVAMLTTAPAAAADLDQNSLKPIDAAHWDRAAAAHLLRRAAFGGTPAEIDKLAALGAANAVDYLLNYRDIPYSPAPPKIDPTLLERPDRALLKTLSEQERQQLQEKRRRADRAAFEEVRLWWLERLAESPRPLEENMTLFWHGHFTSGMREVRSALFMKEQNELLRRLALDNFRELVLGVSRDRAMLVYLDGNRNHKQHPNENYARELMELFTLGVGNYTEADVQAAAQAFTGWGFDEDGFVFRRRDHDYGLKTFLGQTGRFDGADVIDIILEQPACPRFLAKKLLEYFVRPDPDKKLVEALAHVIRQQKYELKPILRTLLLSQAFYHPRSRGCLIKSPVALVVGTARQLGVTIADLHKAERALTAMGQELMQPPNVKGWDGGTEWINTATLFHRYNTVGGLIHGTGGEPRRPAAMLAGRGAAKAETPEAGAMAAESMPAMTDGKPQPMSRAAGGKQPPYDPLWAIREQGLQTPEQIVDLFVGHLLAVPLSAEKRTALVAYLAGESGKLNLGDRRTAERVRMMIHLLCSTPEYQMN